MPPHALVLGLKAVPELELRFIARRKADMPAFGGAGAVAFVVPDEQRHAEPDAGADEPASSSALRDAYVSC